ncbi:Protein of uncharacterised function (DUF551) [Yersinia nurmii]|uniref:Protein of uncharacterized function (DUF551) n=1 Tax=Yersinia nurmii TaxID=685706 RepID=A0ABP1YJL5_9GAMM|nr:DUF551 domain-containing protein [Yersinia nurmii]CNF25292.1 Protein of uncharacterised function (DUF551) [Yersinia nurmii]
MKELDSFTVERLEELARAKMISGHDIADIRALARIALSAKQAEPVAYGTLQKEFCDEERSLFTDKDSASKYSESCYDLTPLYTAPQLNSPEIPEGWIKCSDRMPESKVGVLVASEPDGKGSRGMKWATYIPGHPDARGGWLIPGASWEPTHWMPLPAAPEKENG